MTDGDRNSPDRHLYGLRVELEQQGRFSRIDFVVYMLLLGVIGCIVGFGSLLDPEATNPDYAWLWGVCAAVGTVLVLWCVFVTVRGFGRWRRTRATEKDAIAAYDAARNT